MIFRDSNYVPIQGDQNTQNLLEEVKDFARKLAPTEWQSRIEDIYNELTVSIFNTETKNHKRIIDGELKDANMSGAAAYMYRENVNFNEWSCTQGIALHPKASQHIIVHEMLHALSDEMGENNSGYFVKCGARFSQYDTQKENMFNRGGDLNESITDSLASRFAGKLGPSSGASYADNVIVADLLIGEHAENNKFLQNVYWGDGKEFAEDFNNTVKSSNVKFEEYYEHFKIVTTDNASGLLKGALEYGLRKAQTPQELENVNSFQKKVLNLYKDGGIVTNFMGDDEIQMIEDVSAFADGIKKECKQGMNNPHILKSLQEKRQNM